MPSIIGVALTQAGKFLGFVDGKGKIRKGSTKRVRINPRRGGRGSSWLYKASVEYPYKVYTDGGYGPPKYFRKKSTANKFAKRTGSRVVKN